MPFAILTSVVYGDLFFERYQFVLRGISNPYWVWFGRYYHLCTRGECVMLSEIAFNFILLYLRHSLIFTLPFGGVDLKEKIYVVFDQQLVISIRNSVTNKSSTRVT